MRVMSNSVGLNQAASEGGALLAGGFVRYGLALFYAFALCYAYKVLSFWWGYFGFTYGLPNDTLAYAGCFAAALPAVLLNPHPRTFAESSAWFLYTIVFLPCLLVPIMQYASYGSRIAEVFGATFIACVLFLLIVRGDVKRVTVPTAPPQLFWGLLTAIWLGMLVLVVLGYGSSFHFVAADEVYDQRFGGATKAANPAVRYSIALLSSGIDPFLIAAGLYSRRYWLAGVGVASQIILFGTLAARSTLLSPLFIIGIYFLSDRQGRMRGNLLLIGLVSIFVITSPLLVRYNPMGGGLDQLMSFLYLRTLLIAGGTYGVYQQFFSIFPVTYFSNIHPFSFFLTYPYGDLSVGQVVQSFLIPITSTDIPELNANFLATDGMASLGVLGVPLSGVVTAAVLRLLSRFVPPERTMFMLSAGTVFMLALSNSSLFTALVTGGGILVVFLVSAVPIEKS